MLDVSYTCDKNIGRRRSASKNNSSVFSISAQLLFESHICRHPGQSQDCCAESLCLDKTTVAHHLLKLEKLGYADRRVSPEDGRARCIFPTQAALAIYPRIHASYETFTAALLVGLSEADQQELTRLSELLYRNAIGLISDQGGTKQ